jgi:hypothetical protein
MLSLNETTLANVVDVALLAVKDDRRWTNAILRAEQLLTSGNPYLHFNGARLLILSDSGEVYEANGVCQCRAFAKNHPCKHRAAYKLLRRYMESA